MTPKERSVLPTKKFNSPKRTQVVAAKKQHEVPVRSLSKGKQSVDMAQDEPQKQLSEELDATSDDNKERCHLEQDKQLEDSSPHLNKNSIAVTQNDLNEESCQKSNMCLECNRKERTPKKRKAISA